MPFMDAAFRDAVHLLEMWTHQANPEAFGRRRSASASSG